MIPALIRRRRGSEKKSQINAVQDFPVLLHMLTTDHCGMGNGARVERGEETVTHTWSIAQADLVLAEGQPPVTVRLCRHVSFYNRQEHAIKLSLFVGEDEGQSLGVLGGRTDGGHCTLLEFELPARDGWQKWRTEGDELKELLSATRSKKVGEAEVTALLQTLWGFATGPGQEQVSSPEPAAEPEPASTAS